MGIDNLILVLGVSAVWLVLTLGWSWQRWREYGRRARASRKLAGWVRGQGR